MKIVISESPPYFLDLDAPALPAEAVEIGGSQYWRVWCKHCRAFHYHGPAEGHREAHCKDLDSLYSGTGYNLALREEKGTDLYVIALLVAVAVIALVRVFLFPL